MNLSPAKSLSVRVWLAALSAGLLVLVGWEFVASLREARANFVKESHNLALSDEAKIAQRLRWMKATLDLVATDRVVETFVAAGGGLPPMARPRVEPVFDLLQQNSEVVSLCVLSFTAPAGIERVLVLGGLNPQAGPSSTEESEVLNSLRVRAKTTRQTYLASTLFQQGGYKVFYLARPIVHRERVVGLVACLFRADELTYGLSPLALSVSETQAGLNVELPAPAGPPGRLYGEELEPAPGWSLKLNRADRFFWERDDVGKAIQGALLKIAVLGLGLVALTNFMRKREALTVSRAKSDLMANISHDIRTPLSGVIGLTRLALKTEVTPVQREYLETVGASAESVVTLLNDMLDLSRMEAGALEFNPKPTDLWDLLYTSLGPFQPQALSRGLELVLALDPELPLSVTVDPTRLSQVLTNLLSNAVKFTHQGSVVLRAESVAGGVEFSVIDTGIGIDPDKQEAIFDPFQQAHVGISGEYGGTGLGLAICRRLVAGMGGELKLESSPGKGSRFEFTLNLAPTSAAFRPESSRFQKFRLVGLPPETESALTRLLKGWGLERTDSGESGTLHLCGAGCWPEPASIPEDSLGVPVVVDAAEAARVEAEQVLMLPFNPKALPALMGAPGEDQFSKPRATRCLRVLLVDDSPVNQKLGRLMLEDLGHRVEIAGNGQEAVERAPSGRFDVILMDLQMPLMNGLEAARALKAAGCEVPIVALTGNALSDDREKCLAAGMQAHLAKPLDERRLEGLLNSLVVGGSDAAASQAESGLPPDWKGKVFDASLALRRVGGDPGNLARVINVFRRILERELPTIKDPRLDRGRRLGALRTLKSAVEPFEANHAARVLESWGACLAEDREPDEAQEAALDSELSELDEALRKFVTERDQ